MSDLESTAKSRTGLVCWLRQRMHGGQQTSSAAVAIAALHRPLTILESASSIEYFGVSGRVGAVPAEGKYLPDVVDDFDGDRAFIPMMAAPGVLPGRLR
ncbi:hypothetical protein [Nocardia sp. NPDC057440]|uniref:hypothetical protein n=1 Tax=Nocardia sp. NPDC057440 TaxID=3346134 RepID=UPI00366C5340